jgi:hypothetical protein
MSALQRTWPLASTAGSSDGFTLRPCSGQATATAKSS